MDSFPFMKRIPSGFPIMLKMDSACALFQAKIAWHTNWVEFDVFITYYSF